MKTLIFSVLGFLMVVPVVAGEHTKVWLGRQFRSEQCIAIQNGAATFTRKLCRIDYRMAGTKNGFEIDGYLTFNPKFLPRLPRSVDLEILLIDNNLTCIDQVNLSREVATPPVHFNLRVPSGSGAVYLRTYYTLHYE